MKPRDFVIGKEFWCAGKRWRCSDIGTRVVVAISLEPHEIVSSEPDPINPGQRIERTYTTDDPVWLNGPPYGVVEHVFDEDSLQGCSFTKEQHQQE
jgi:hypothetical protein